MDVEFWVDVKICSRMIEHIALESMYGGQKVTWDCTLDIQVC